MACTPSSPDGGGNSPDRRRHRRIALTAAVKLRLDDQVLSVHCLDLSLGGARMTGAGVVLPGAVVELDAELGRAHHLRTRAEVVRVDDAEIAVRFVSLDQPSLLALQASIH